MTIPIGGTEILIEDAPARICQDCGETYLNGKYLLELEKKVLRRKLQTA